MVEPLVVASAHISDVSCLAILFIVSVSHVDVCCCQVVTVYFAVGVVFLFTDRSLINFRSYSRIINGSEICPFYEQIVEATSMAGG
jgi:hypothetical protein